LIGQRQALPRIDQCDLSGDVWTNGRDEGLGSGTSIYSRVNK
jgi:hypothetical protein